MAPRLLSRCALLVALFSALWLAAGDPISDSPSASAQANQIQITSLVTDNWPSIEATVTVLDASGQPVTGLSDQAFSAMANGTALPITGITTTSDPSIGIAVVLTFDVSGSMEGEPLNQAKVAGKALLAQLGPTDQAAIVAFSDQPSVRLGFTSDRVALEQAIDALQIGGNTGLYTAVQESANLAAQAPLPRQAVVLLSDGVDFGTSATTRESSLAAARDSGATFMALGLGTALDNAYLSELASVGRGQFLVAPAPGDLQSLYTTVGGILRQQYVLTLNAEALGSDFTEGTLRIEALLPGGTAFAETALAAPAGIQPSVEPSPGATASPAPTDAPQTGEEGGGSSSLPIVIGGIVLVALLVSVPGVLLLRRRSSPGGPSKDSGASAIQLERLQQREAEPIGFPTIERAVSGEETGAWLSLPDGERFNLTTAPMTVGFSADCTVRLTAGPGDSVERARIWLRDGSYMLHTLSRNGSISVAGRPINWVILEDGDAIEFGSATLVFHEPPR